MQDTPHHRDQRSADRHQPDAGRARAGPLPGRDLVAVPGAEVERWNSHAGTSFSVPAARRARRRGVLRGSGAVRPHQRARGGAGADGLQGARLHLHERRQRQQQLRRPARYHRVQPTTRPCAAPAGLAIPQGNLLPVTPPSIGLPFGLHPNLTGLQTAVQPRQDRRRHATSVHSSRSRTERRFQQRDGQAPRTSSSPTPTRSRSGRRPAADTRSQTGWGGRIADRTISLNNGSAFPMVTSITGSAVFGIGVNTRAARDRHGRAEHGPRPVGLQHDAAKPSRAGIRWTSCARSTGPPPSSSPRATRPSRPWTSARAFSVDPVLSTTFPQYGTRQPAPPGRQGHQAQPDGSGALAEPADLLLFHRRIRHAPESARRRTSRCWGSSPRR